jgi:hypothetical protein
MYETAPLVCPKCQGIMHIISSIEDHSVIGNIFEHLGLWLVKSTLIPKSHFPPSFEYDVNYHYHIDATYDNTFYGDSEYPGNLIFNLGLKQKMGEKEIARPDYD